MELHVSNLPGTICSVEPGAVCEKHPDVLAVVKIAGKTDLFGFVYKYQ